MWHKSHSETVINLPQTVAYGKNNTKCCRIVTVFVNPKGLLGECGIITTSSMLHNYNTFKPTYPPLVPYNYSVIPYDYHTLQASHDLRIAHHDVHIMQRFIGKVLGVLKVLYITLRSNVYYI